MVDRASWLPRVPCAADLYDQAAIRPKNAAKVIGKLKKPINITVLIRIAVGFFKVQRIRWRRNNGLHTTIWQELYEMSRITSI